MRYSILFSLLFFYFSSFSQSYLRVADPNDWWTTNTDSDPNWQENLEDGQFDEISLVISPQGIYTQVEFFTTISQGNAYSWWWGDNMEIIWQFRLPQQAIVHDSWLWVGEDIIKADVVDFWTASQIYEEIVDRNQDPSLLYKLPNGSYEIRIFPLPEGESRRIKMSFLLPNSWDENKITTEVLLPMLKSTSLYPEEVEIIIPQNDMWQNPTLMTSQSPPVSHPFSSQTTPFNGDIHYLSIPGEDLANMDYFDLQLDAPWSGNTWLQTYEEEGDKFYQLAIKPDWGYVNDTMQVEQDTTGRVLILIDRESSKTTLSREILAQNIEAYLLNPENEINTFGLMASVTDSIQSYNGDWVVNNSANIDTVFAAYLEDTDESDLEGLLTEAFTLVNEGNPIKKIVLFSANDAFVFPSLAEELLDNILPLLPDNTPIDIYDHQDLNISNVFDNDQEYIANHQLFFALSQLTNGLLYELRNSTQTLYEILTAEIISAPQVPVGVIDLSVDMQTGICYQEQNLFSSYFYEEGTTVLYQTGRYLGDLSFEVEASLILDNGDFFTYETTIDTSTISQGDTLMREIWYGNYLREESLTVENNDDLLQVIQQSIEERVLIPQTAFLALEPSQGGTVCIPCLDTPGNIIINVTDVKVETKEELSISPNPARTVVQIKLDGIENPSTASVEIFDSKGQFIQSLTNGEVVDNTVIWTWDIEEKTPSGVYICRLTLPHTTLTHKIMVVK